MNKNLINKISDYFLKQTNEKARLFCSYPRSEEKRIIHLDILVHFIPKEKNTMFKYITIFNDLQALNGEKN